MDLNKILERIKQYFLSGELDFLETLDVKSIAPICAALGIDAATLCPILNMLPPLLKGQLELKKLLPYLIPALLPLIFKGKPFDGKSSDNIPLKGTIGAENMTDYSAENSEKTTYSQVFEQKNSATDQIGSFAENDILYSVNAYLNSDSAS